MIIIWIVQIHQKMWVTQLFEMYSSLLCLWPDDYHTVPTRKLIQQIILNARPRSLLSWPHTEIDRQLDKPLFLNPCCVASLLWHEFNSSASDNIETVYPGCCETDSQIQEYAYLQLVSVSEEVYVAATVTFTGKREAVLRQKCHRG